MCVGGGGWGEGGVVSCEEEGRGCSHSPSHFLATIFTLTLKRKKEKKYSRITRLSTAPANL